MQVILAKTKKDINTGLRVIKNQFLKKHGYTMKDTKEWFFNGTDHQLIVVKNSIDTVVGALVFRYHGRWTIYISYVSSTIKKHNIAKLMLIFLESWTSFNYSSSVDIVADLRNYNYASIILFKSLHYRISQGNLKYEDDTMSLKVRKKVIII